MEQNDIVAQILQMIKGGQAPQSPQLPGQPTGIMPHGPEMPESNDRIALAMALGLNPEFPETEHDVNAPAVQALIQEQRQLMRPVGRMPQNDPLAPSHMQMNGYQKLKKLRQGGGR